MPKPIRSLAVLGAALLLTGATCGRPVAVESEPTGAAISYRLEVVNATGRDLSVYYGPAGAPTRLGTVGANGREQFVIVAPADATVRIEARSSGNQPIERTVTLRAGAVTTVTLR